MVILLVTIRQQIGGKDAEILEKRLRYSWATGCIDCNAARIRNSSANDVHGLQSECAIIQPFQ